MRFRDRLKFLLNSSRDFILLISWNQFSSAKWRYSVPKLGKQITTLGVKEQCEN